MKSEGIKPSSAALSLVLLVQLIHGETRSFTEVHSDQTLSFSNEPLDIPATGSFPVFVKYNFSAPDQLVVVDLVNADGVHGSGHVSAGIGTGTTMVTVSWSHATNLEKIELVLWAVRRRVYETDPSHAWVARSVSAVHDEVFVAHKPVVMYAMASGVSGKAANVDFAKSEDVCRRQCHDDAACVAVGFNSAKQECARYAKFQKAETSSPGVKYSFRGCLKCWSLNSTHCEGTGGQCLEKKAGECAGLSTPCPPLELFSENTNLARAGGWSDHVVKHSRRRLLANNPGNPAKPPTFIPQAIDPTKDVMFRSSFYEISGQQREIKMGFGQKLNYYKFGMFEVGPDSNVVVQDPCLLAHIHEIQNPPETTWRDIANIYSPAKAGCEFCGLGGPTVNYSLPVDPKIGLRGWVKPMRPQMIMGVAEIDPQDMLAFNNQIPQTIGVSGNATEIELQRDLKQRLQLFTNFSFDSAPINGRGVVVPVRICRYSNVELGALGACGAVMLLTMVISSKFNIGGH